MALRKPKKKAKKNPYRLSSDRQPGIKKANEKKPSRRRRLLPKDLEDFFKRKPKPSIPKELRPFFPKPKRFMEPQPYRPKRPKDLDKYYQLLKAKPKSGQAKPKVTKKRGGGIAQRGMGKAK
jgi:hypothetical protein